MRFIFFSILLLIIVSACNYNQKNNTISKKHREFKIIDSLSQRKYGVSYDSLGRKYREGEYLKNYAIGLHYFYDSLGILRYVREYVRSVDYLPDVDYNLEESHLNQVYAFDQNCRLDLSKSNFIKLKIQKDTIDLNDSLRMTIDIISHHYKNSVFDVIYSVPDDTSLVTLATYFKTPWKFSYKPIKRGNFELIGIIRELDTTKEINEQDTIYVKSRKMYFKKRYIIK
jgi:hypothetical protein